MDKGYQKNGMIKRAKRALLIVRFLCVVLINSRIYSERSPANWSIYAPNAHSTQQPFSLRSLKLDIRPKGAEGPLVTNTENRFTINHGLRIQIKRSNTVKRTRSLCGLLHREKLTNSGRMGKLMCQDKSTTTERAQDIKR